jgi:hypothetical protein
LGKKQLTEVGERFNSIYHQAERIQQEGNLISPFDPLYQVDLIKHGKTEEYSNYIRNLKIRCGFKPNQPVTHEEEEVFKMYLFRYIGY